MNDPGLEEPIEHASSAVHDKYREQPHEQSKSDKKGQGTNATPTTGETLNSQSPAYSKGLVENGDTAYQLPTRWWYASTGFPLIAGTFGPMANAFSICALVENWRVEVPPGGTEEHGIDIPDPKWLIAVNAVSLAFALIANLSLLLNMAKRVPFRWAQPVTISGFWISSVLLTVLVGIAAHELRDPNVQKQALSQAYYYACWAAGLYQIISLMMCVTVYGALTNRYSSDFNLTMAQRTLMLQTIAFLTYLLIGALIFSHVEGWTYPNAVYWADFTLLTVGIGGDMVPTTHLGRSLLFPFSIGGIVTLGLVVSSIRNMVLDRGKVKLYARMTEKMRRRVVKQVDQASAEGKARRQRVTGLNKDLVQRLTLEPSDDPDDELDRRRAEFEAMREVEELTNRRQKWMNLVVSTTAFAVLWFVGALIFWQTEGRNQGWSYFVSLYFAWTSLLTIGYGDFVPLSNAGRPFFVFWSLLAIPSLTILISDMGDTVVKGVKDATIWIGEVTILPSDNDSMRERLRYGLSKSFGIKNSHSSHQDEEASNSDSNSNTPFQQPGLVKLFNFSKRRSSRARGSDTNERVSRDFEEAERQDEQEAHERGDQAAEDEHHYRHMLLAEIRKVYADTNLATPKKYSYDEWAHFLKLLGEDESSSAFHRHARVKPPKKDQPHRSDNSLQSDGISRWSWIGPRSPLMTRGDKSESEWLVTRLFERLEESLRGLHEEKLAAAGVPPDASTQSSSSRDKSPKAPHESNDNVAEPDGRSRPG